MHENDLAHELAVRLKDLADNRIDLQSVLDWGGSLDLAAGARPVGAHLFPGGGPPSRLDGFAPPSDPDCRILAAAVARSIFAVEDVIGLVVLRHQRGASETPLVSWLVRFGALHPSQVDDLLEGLEGRDTGR